MPTHKINMYNSRQQRYCHKATTSFATKPQTKRNTLWTSLLANQKCGEFARRLCCCFTVCLAAALFDVVEGSKLLLQWWMEAWRQCACPAVNVYFGGYQNDGWQLPQKSHSPQRHFSGCFYCNTVRLFGWLAGPSECSKYEVALSASGAIG